MWSMYNETTCLQCVECVSALLLSSTAGMTLPHPSFAFFSLSIALSAAGLSCSHVKLSLSLSDVGVSDGLFREDGVWFDEFLVLTSVDDSVFQSHSVFGFLSHCILVLFTRQESLTVAHRYSWSFEEFIFISNRSIFTWFEQIWLCRTHG